MHKFKKWFINNKLRDEKNLRQVKKLLEKTDLKNVADALEIGCGDGMVSAYLSDNYHINVIGVDIDPEQIKTAKKLYGQKDGLHFLEADAIKLPFEKNKFDMVLTLNVFHHIGNWAKTLDEINRVLKNNGFLIFTGFTYSDFITNVYRKINEKYDVFTMNEIINLLSDHNFKVISIDKPNTARIIGGIRFRYYRGIFQKNKVKI